MELSLHPTDLFIILLFEKKEKKKETLAHEISKKRFCLEMENPQLSPLHSTPTHSLSFSP
jgi:hypothetical protein